MCSLVILRRPGHSWPLIVAANRDEMADRPWKPPARHWPDRPGVTAGLDELAEGSWMGVNEEGVMAAILNRFGTLGPQPGKRSRGELVLDALDYPDASDAALALAQLDTRAYRSFNLVVADNRDAFLVINRGDSPQGPGPRHRPEVLPIPEGLHMVTAFDLDDQQDPRIALHLPRFRAAAVPNPDANHWGGWPEALASREWSGTRGEAGAMDFTLDTGFGTVCSSLLALPAPGHALPGRPDVKPQWRFAAGRPSEIAWQDLELG